MCPYYNDRVKTLKTGGKVWTVCIFSYLKISQRIEKKAAICKSSTQMTLIYFRINLGVEVIETARNHTSKSFVSTVLYIFENHPQLK